MISSTSRMPHVEEINNFIFYTHDLANIKATLTTSQA